MLMHACCLLVNDLYKIDYMQHNVSCKYIFYNFYACLFLSFACMMLMLPGVPLNLPSIRPSLPTLLSSLSRPKLNRGMSIPSPMGLSPRGDPSAKRRGWSSRPASRSVSAMEELGQLINTTFDLSESRYKVDKCSFFSF